MQYALITGASKGIGKAIAGQLAKKGYSLLLVARSESLLKELSIELQARYKIDIKCLTIDLSQAGAAEKVKEWCDKHNFDISILINNAGYGLWGRFEQLTLADQQNMMQLNMVTLTELTYLILPFLRLQPQSYVLNISSTAAYQAVPCFSLYAASKAFVLSFSRGLSYELRNSNVSVSCMSPGSTSTHFMERAKMEALQKTAEKFTMDPEDVAKIGLDGMFSKTTEIIPGMVNKFSARIASFVPKSVLEKVAAGIYEKYLQHQ